MWGTIMRENQLITCASFSFLSCVHSSRRGRPDDGCWLLWLFWGCAWISMSTCIGKRKPANIIRAFFWQNSTSWLLYFLFVPQFFACLLIIFGAEIVAGVFGFINKEQVYYSNNDWVWNELLLLLSSNFILFKLLSTSDCGRCPKLLHELAHWCH